MGADTDPDFNWIAYLTVANPRPWPVIKHLLLIQFLGYSAEQFFTFPIMQSEEANPLGNGPWPCLNPVCENYRRRVIQDYVVTYNHYRQEEKAIFRCACGFVYARFISDTCHDDPFSLNQIQQYGYLWDSKFRELWESDKPIVVQLGLLGLNNYPIYHRHAQRLGLEGSHADEIELNKPDDPANSDKTLFYREIWTKGRRDNPNAKIGTLRSKFKGAYNWLSLHDKTWFDENIPSSPSWRVPRKN